MKITTDFPAVLYLKKKDKKVAAVIDESGDIECHEHFDAFSFIAKEIVEQMLSIKAADCIRGRFAKMIGGEFTSEALLALSQDELRHAGMSWSKADYLLGFASAIAEERIDLSSLTVLRGIGIWTAKMYLIFVLQREDVLPYEDGAFMQAVRWLHGIKNSSRGTVIKRCRKWKPYSSIAARYM